MNATKTVTVGWLDPVLGADGFPSGPPDYVGERPVASEGQVAIEHTRTESVLRAGTTLRELLEHPRPYTARR